MSTTVALGLITDPIKGRRPSLKDTLLRMASTNGGGLFLNSVSSEETEEEALETGLFKYVTQRESALLIAQRLFYHELNTTDYQKQRASWGLNCLAPEALEQLYSKGWTEIEGIMDLDILKG